MMAMANVAVHPAAQELCDNIHNICSEIIDAGYDDVLLLGEFALPHWSSRACLSRLWPDRNPNSLREPRWTKFRGEDPFPDGNITYTAATGNIQAPRWSQQNDLYFLNRELHVIEDVSARIARGTALTSQQVLPEGVLNADYDVTSDGERFITIRKYRTEFEARVNLILNWQAAPATARVTPR